MYTLRHFIYLSAVALLSILAQPQEAEAQYTPRGMNLSPAPSDTLAYDHDKVYTAIARKVNYDKQRVKSLCRIDYKQKPTQDSPYVRAVLVSPQDRKEVDFYIQCNVKDYSINDIEDFRQ